MTDACIYLLKAYYLYMQIKELWSSIYIYIYIYILRVNHPQTKAINELEETEYNNYKLLQHDCNLIVVYFLQDNHGSGSYQNVDIKVFKNHRVSDHLYTIILSIGRTILIRNLIFFISIH